MISKKELRKEILKRRDAMTIDEREIKSRQIAEQIFQMKEFLEADILLLYASYRSEVATSEIFDRAKKLSKAVYCPKVQGNEMEFYQVKGEEDLLKGYHGICEPSAKQVNQFASCRHEKVCVIIPGSVFDAKGNRIGYGGGYYDKYMQQLEKKNTKENIVKIALAFECQIVEEGLIVREEHDAAMDFVVTERRIVLTKDCK